MDGGSAGYSGGGEIAAAYVTIGADMAPLRAAEQEARQIVERLGQLGANLGTGGGGGGGGGTVLGGGSINASPSYGTSGFSGGSTGTMSISPAVPTIDFSSSSQSVRTLTGEIQTLTQSLQTLKSESLNMGSLVGGGGGSIDAGNPALSAGGGGRPFHVRPRVAMETYGGTTSSMGLDEPEEFTAPADPFAAPVYIGRHPRGISRMRSSRMRDVLEGYGEAPEPMGLLEPAGGITGGPRPSMSRGRFTRNRMNEVYGESPEPMGLEPGDGFAAPSGEVGDELFSGEANSNPARLQHGRSAATPQANRSGMLQRMAIRMAAAATVYKGAQLVYNAWTASVIESHPEEVSKAMMQPGGSVDFVHDPGVSALSQQMASLKASDQRWSGFEWFDFSRLGRQRMEGEAQRGLAGAAYQLDQEQTLPAGLYRAQGLEARAVASEQNRLRSQAHLATDATELRLRKLNFGDNATFSPGDPYLFATDPEMVRAMANEGRVNRTADLTTAQAQAVQAAQFYAINRGVDVSNTEAAAAGVGTMASNVRRAGGVGASAEARRLERLQLQHEQDAAQQQYDIATNTAVAGALPAEKEPLRAQRAAGRAALGEQQGLATAGFDRQTDVEIKTAAEFAVHTEAQANEARLRGTRDFYQAQLAAINEGERAKIAEIKLAGGTAAELGAATSLGASQRAALAEESAFDRSQSGILSAGSVAAAGLRRSRNFFAAGLASFDAQQHAGIGAADPAHQDVMGMIQAYIANRGAMIVGHAQDLQLEREGYQGETTVANDLSADNPISARADAAIARARRSVQTASPENRADAIAAGRAQLRAEMHQLTAQRGGDTAIDMSLGEAIGTMTGRGIDLTGRMRDINNARGNLQGGINDLPNAKLTESAPMDPEAKEFLRQCAETLLQIARSGGAALFN